VEVEGSTGWRRSEEKSAEERALGESSGGGERKREWWRRKRSDRERSTGEKVTVDVGAQTRTMPRRGRRGAKGREKMFYPSSQKFAL